MTFRSLYEAEKKKPTAAQAFIAKVAALTEAGEATVRMWLTGRTSPDRLAQRTIAEYFGMSIEQLFPKHDSDEPSKANNNEPSKTNDDESID